MKQGVHPAYGPVAFRDRPTGRVVVIGSTLVSQASNRTVELDNTRYPIIDVDISSSSHPFWTRSVRRLDTEGRVQAFERRYGRRA